MHGNIDCTTKFVVLLNEFHEHVLSGSGKMAATLSTLKPMNLNITVAVALYLVYWCSGGGLWCNYMLITC